MILEGFPNRKVPSEEAFLCGLGWSREANRLMKSRTQSLVATSPDQAQAVGNRISSDDVVKNICFTTWL